MAETPADDAQTPATDGVDAPGPRLARTLERQARARRSRARLLFGLGFLVLGAIVVGLAVWSFSSDDPSKQRSVGKLTGQDLEGDTQVASKSEVPAAGAGSTATTAAGATPTGKAQWPSVTAGRPREFGKLNDPPPPDGGSFQDGFYLWQDFDGWHLWVIGGSPEDRVTITTDGEISKADPIGGAVAVERTANTFTFSRGDATETVVGVEFNPGYYARTIIATTEGGLRLHVGFTHKIVPNAYGMSFSTAST